MTPREKVLNEVDRIAFWHGVGIMDVMSHYRRRPVVAARRDCAVYLRSKGKSFPEIGRILQRDHTTVMNLFYGKGWKHMHRQVAR
jgi:chromosomal replication initiation ATPase DnaA